MPESLQSEIPERLLLFHPYFSESLLATFLGERMEFSVIANPLFVFPAGNQWNPCT
jgi:hypothetical protein